MAGRILGMGDMLTLIEKAEDVYTEQQAQEMEEKLLAAEFTLEDFLDQFQQLKKMGPLQGLLGMVPGVGRQLKDVDIDDRELVRVEAIIQSMTPEERRKPKILNGKRKKRIARGSGRSAQEVNQLLRSFDQMRGMMKQLGGAHGLKAMRAMGDLDMETLAAGGGLPPGMPSMGGVPGGLGGHGAAPAPARPRGKSVPKRKRKKRKKR
jgi:signal recognition particle subunit SRP54